MKFIISHDTEDFESIINIGKPSFLTRFMAFPSTKSIEDSNAKPFKQILSIKQFSDMSDGTKSKIEKTILQKISFDFCKAEK
jgi:hypothetical protein